MALEAPLEPGAVVVIVPVVVSLDERTLFLTAGRDDLLRKLVVELAKILCFLFAPRHVALGLFSVDTCRNG